MNKLIVGDAGKSQFLCRFALRPASADVTYLKDNIDKVKGFVITHGHEDHIGALPYVLRDVNAPIYGTKLTLGIIEGKLQEHNLKRVKKKVVKYGQSINLGCFRIEFIRTNHSIVDAAALAIFTPRKSLHDFLS